MCANAGRAKTLLLLVARTSRFPLRAAEGGGPRIQAAAATDRGQARRCWLRRPHELTEFQGFLRSAAVRCGTATPCSFSRLPR